MNSYINIRNKRKNSTTCYNAIHIVGIKLFDVINFMN